MCCIATDVLLFVERIYKGELVIMIIICFHLVVIRNQAWNFMINSIMTDSARIKFNNKIGMCQVYQYSDCYTYAKIHHYDLCIVK